MLDLIARIEVLNELTNYAFAYYKEAAIGYYVSIDNRVASITIFGDFL